MKTNANHILTSSALPPVAAGMRRRNLNSDQSEQCPDFGPCLERERCSSRRVGARGLRGPTPPECRPGPLTRRSAGKLCGLKRGLSLAFLFLALGASLAHAATITWDGGGGDLSWQNALNWSGDQVPGPSDDVVINLPPDVTIRCNSDVTVRSVQCQGGLNIAGGNFEVTAGSSFVEGLFTMKNRSLHAKGWNATTTFVAKGATVIEGDVGVYASYGAALLLTNLTSFVATNCQPAFSVSYGGGLLDLSGLTNVVVVTTMWNSPARLTLSVEGGGRLDLRNARITASDVPVRADGAGSVVDLSGLSGEWGTTDYKSTWTVRNGGTILIPHVTGLSNVNLSLEGTNGTPVSQLTSIRGGGLDVSGFSPNLSNLVSLDGSGLVARNNARLDLNHVKEVSDLRSVMAYGTGSILLTNVTSLVVTNAGTDFFVESGGLLDLSRVTNLMVSLWLNVRANPGGRVDLRGLESITGWYSANFLADGAGSVIDLSRLSCFLTGGFSSSLKAQNGGVILLNNSTVFLLANVAVTLPGLIVQPTPAMVLHALPWYSYWVEQRDTRWPDSPWQFMARVPMTTTFQTFAPAPPPNTAFRVREFVADPPILDLGQAGNAQTQLILYGATNKTYAVQSTNALSETPGDWPLLETVNMTNSFRIFPPAAATEEKQFFRAREL